MKILFAATECSPFILNSELGDNISYLLNELNHLDADIETRIILPKFISIKEDLFENLEFVSSFYVFIGTKANKVGLYKQVYNGVIYYFLENDKYFLDDNINNLETNHERWTIYQIGVLESLKYMDDFTVDVINCHGWNTGLIPYLIKKKYYKEYNYVKTVYTINNAMEQGEFDRQVIKLYNLPSDNQIELNGKINFMKAGIQLSDYVNSFSKEYAKELLLSSYFSKGLSQFLQTKYKNKQFIGIATGIDNESFNPFTDKTLEVNYDINNFIEGKKSAKQTLYKEINCDFYTDKLLICITSKLIRQKGIDLIKNSINELLLDDSFKLLILSNGDKEYEDFFMDLEKCHPFKVKFIKSFDNHLKRLVIAASDAIIVPSLFESSGLEHIYALRYGTVPLVRMTGTLKDFVQPFDGEYKENDNGFGFNKYDVEDFKKTFIKMVEVFKDKELWNKLVYNTLNIDTSLRLSAIKYYKVYKRTLLK